MKLPRLVLQVEISKYHSLVLIMGQYVVTQLSKLASFRLNMDMLFVRTSGLSIHLYKGIHWLYCDANREILFYLFQLNQLIVQHLE